MSDSIFKPIHRTAGLLGVPVAWLRDEAKAGRVPYLKVGRRILFDPETVERVLVERLQNDPPEGEDVE